MLIVFDRIHEIIIHYNVKKNPIYSFIIKIISLKTISIDFGILSFIILISTQICMYILNNQVNFQREI